MSTNNNELKDLIESLDKLYVTYPSLEINEIDCKDDDNKIFYKLKILTKGHKNKIKKLSKATQLSASQSVDGEYSIITLTLQKGQCYNEYFSCSPVETINRIKPTLEERINKAKEQAENVPRKKSEILKLIKDSLTEINKIIDIEAVPCIVEFKNVKYDRMPKIQNKWTSLIFIQFTKSGHIAVVGAGEDISLSYNSTTGKILNALIGIDKEYKWDTESLIIIPIIGLKSIGLKGINNVLECRNGIENYIGNYLSLKGVPILNYYQHWNYKKEIWREWEKQDFILYTK